MSKSKQYKAQWQEKINGFLDINYRPMLNKNNTILKDGKEVAKGHLLTTKLDVIRSLKKKTLIIIENS